MNGEFQRVVSLHRERYPLMEPQDYGKLAYQSEFGPEHLVSDPAQAQRRIAQEWETAASRPPLPVEPLGNHLCRFSLTGQYPSREAAPLLSRLFLQSARQHTGTRAGLEERLEVLEALHDPALSAWLERYRQAGCPAIRHSDSYRAAYDPHYRVLRALYAYYFPVLMQVQRLLCTHGAAVISVDGRCGSGKTGLAALLQALFPCNVFHMDDFYLPMDRRAENWMDIPAGNMDLDRFLREILLPAKSGETVLYRPFLCKTREKLAAVPYPPQPLTVIEGSYSQHPQLFPAYDWSIFLTCSKSEQERRLRQREGAHFAAFETCWIPMEERYFQLLHPQQRCSFLLDTSEFFSF